MLDIAGKAQHDARSTVQIVDGERWEKLTKRVHLASPCDRTVQGRAIGR